MHTTYLREHRLFDASPGDGAEEALGYSVQRGAGCAVPRIPPAYISQSVMSRAHSAQNVMSDSGTWNHMALPFLIVTAPASASPRRWGACSTQDASPPYAFQ